MAGWNFMAAETGIVNALEAATQAGPDAWCRAVGTRAEMELVAEEAQLDPALWVVYDGFRVIDADEYSATLLHRWFVVLAVASAAAQREAAARNQLAGPRLAQVLDTLHGMTLPQSTTPLVPTTPPKPYYSPAKFAYFPLAFTHESYLCKGR